MDDNDRAQLLMQEWQTLRQEMLARININNASKVFFIGGLAVLVSLGQKFNMGLLLAFTPLLVVLLASLLLNQLTLMFWLAMYLSRKEQQINKLAGTKLLRWDSERSSPQSLTGLFIPNHCPWPNPIGVTIILFLVFFIGVFFVGLYFGRDSIVQNFGRSLAALYTAFVLGLGGVTMIGYVSFMKLMHFVKKGLLFEED